MSREENNDRRELGAAFGRNRKGIGFWDLCIGFNFTVILSDRLQPGEGYFNTETQRH